MCHLINFLKLIIFKWKRKFQLINHAGNVVTRPPSLSNFRYIFSCFLLIWRSDNFRKVPLQFKTIFHSICYEKLSILLWDNFTEMTMLLIDLPMQICCILFSFQKITCLFIENTERLKIRLCGRCFKEYVTRSQIWPKLLKILFTKKLSFPFEVLQ